MSFDSEDRMVRPPSTKAWAPPRAQRSGGNSKGRPSSSSADAASLDVALQISHVLVNLMEFADPYYRGGTALTRHLAACLCDHLYIDGPQRQSLLIAAVLRDVGRLLMQSRGQLVPMDPPPSPKENDVIRRHVGLGLDLLDGVDLPADARLIIRHHHERWDGNGYPDGLRGESIPMGARILSVADSVSSMLRPRPYRLPRRFEDVKEELKRESGKQFDPAIVSAVANIFHAGGLRLLGLGERQHVILAPAVSEWTDLLAVRLSGLGYLAEVRGLDEVRDRALRVPVEAIVISYGSDPIACNQLLEEIRRTHALRDMTIVTVDAPDASSRAHALSAGADSAFGALDFETLRQVLAAMVSQSVRRRGQRPDGPDLSLPAMTGRLEDFEVAWLLQWLNYNSATAAVELEHRGVQGTIWMIDGEPVDAALGQVVGVEAVRHLLGWPSGRFNLRMGHKPSGRTIESPLVSLLLKYGAEDDRETVLYGAVEGGG